MGRHRLRRRIRRIGLHHRHVVDHQHVVADAHRRSAGVVGAFDDDRPNQTSMVAASACP